MKGRAASWVSSGLSSGFVGFEEALVVSVWSSGLSAEVGLLGLIFVLGVQGLSFPE